MHVMYVQSCNGETHDLHYEASVQRCANFKMQRIKVSVHYY